MVLFTPRNVLMDVDGIHAFFCRVLIVTFKGYGPYVLKENLVFREDVHHQECYKKLFLFLSG